VTPDTLTDFVRALDGAGELIRVRDRVSTNLEITEIADRMMKQPGGGKALLFEHPVLMNGERSEFPVGINLFGSMRRMAMALGVERLDEIGDRITELLQTKPPQGIVAKLALLPRLLEVAKFPPRMASGTPPCQDVIWRGPEVDLGKLPLTKCWPEDGGAYITVPMVITRDPKRGIRNVGMYRIMQTGRDTLAMHWQRHKVGAAHWREMAERGETMPVCIAIGADPPSMYSASAPLPPTIDEFLFSGFLRKRPVQLAKALTCDLEVPAEADFVLEGYIDPSEALVMEGPFGDHTGYYSLARNYPVFHLTALTRRARPIYPATIVGRPPQEDYWLGKATERLFLPIMKLMLPEIVDVNMPAEGVFHNLVIVSIKKRYPGHARKVMTALWGMGLMMLAKTIVVVSEHVNVHDLSEVAWRATGNIDPRRDLMILEGPMDDLDHAALRHRYGGKLGVDATEKGPLDDVVQTWPDEILMTDEIRERVTRRWKDYGL